MASHHGGRFRAQTAVSQTDGNKAQSQSVRHLFLAKITFRSNQHQHIPTPFNFVLQNAFILFVAMSDEVLLIFLSLLANERVIGC